MRPSIRSKFPSQRFPAAIGKLKTDRIALFGSFFRRAPRTSRRIHARLLADNPLRHRGRKRERVNARSRTKNTPQTANTHAPTRKLFQPEGYEIISQRLSFAVFSSNPKKFTFFCPPRLWGKTLARRSAVERSLLSVSPYRVLFPRQSPNFFRTPRKFPQKTNGAVLSGTPNFPPFPRQEKVCTNTARP